MIFILSFSILFVLSHLLCMYMHAHARARMCIVTLIDFIQFLNECTITWCTVI